MIKTPFIKTILVCCLLLFPLSSRAQVITDGTVGQAMSLDGPDYQISQNLGTTANNNLFHSFQSFSISQGESATFTGSNSIKNIISRVTGGEVSHINGLLRSEIGTAAFYFINPAGVIFDKNARIDVPGDFHISTADGLRFADGSLFSINPDNSTLTSSLPESFAYLQPQAASIELNGCELNFVPKTKVTINAGELEFNNSDLWLENGELRISAMGDATGAVPMDGDLPNQGNGDIHIDSTGLYTSGNNGGLIYLNGGDVTLISSDLFADNEGEIDSKGGIQINTSNLTMIDSWIAADLWAQGNGGQVEVNVEGLLQILDGSVITSSTYFTGNAGSVSVTAGTLTMAGQNSSSPTGINSITYFDRGDAGQVLVNVKGILQILDGAEISTGTHYTGNAGSVSVTAGKLTMAGHGSSYPTGISSQANFQGNAGQVNINVHGLLQILDDARISCSTFSTGKAGSITVTAGELTMEGQDSANVTGIGSLAERGSQGDAGQVDVNVHGFLQILDGALISSSTFSTGKAGSITVTAGELTMDGHDSASVTGIVSQAESDSQGDAGQVEVNVHGLLQILDGALISSSTSSRGKAGSVTVNAGNLIMDNNESSYFTGITSQAASGSQGDAGQVLVNVDDLLQILDDARISSSTFSSGKAGSVTVTAGELIMDGHDSASVTGIASQANSDSQGDAGQVEVDVHGLLQILDGARISSSTSSSGKAGSVKINAGELIMDNNESFYFTGITSQANKGSRGDAGHVEVNVDGLLKIINGARITSSTFSYGNAGSIMVNAGDILIDEQGSNLFTGIRNEANIDSIGMVGNITINTESLDLVNNGTISITGKQTMPADIFAAPMDTGFIDITAERISLNHNSAISAATSGNVPASTVNIQAKKLFINDSSRITTSANEADGGAIAIKSDQVILMDGLITTSVNGKSGDGGNISISGMNGPSQVIIMNSGFIQANTAAAEASGGNIHINAEAIIASCNNLEIGGTERHKFTAGAGLNIIQAAAPDGEQGLITLYAPRLDLSATLVDLDSNLLEPIKLATDPCILTDTEEANSLIFTGQ